MCVLGGWGGISTCVCVGGWGGISKCVCWGWGGISKTHSSASSSQSSHVSPALDRLPALPLQVWLTGLE